MPKVTATAALAREHRIVEKVIASLAVLADRLEMGRAVEAATLQDAVDFMRLVYQVHEPKEEVHLFPALQRRGVSLHSVPTRMLVEEHRRGGALVAALEKAADEYSGGNASARESLLASLRGLVALYPLHIWREDLLLFHQADNVLTPEDNVELVEAFDRVDESSGGDVQRRLQEMAERVERGTW